MSFAALLPMMLKSGFTVSLAGPPTTNTATKGPAGPAASIVFTLNTDGTGTFTGSIFTAVNFNWGSPTTVGIGASYYARFTETITLNNGSLGGTTSGNMAASVLSTARAYTVTSDVVTNTITSSLLVEIADSLAFTNIVASRTFTLSAQKA